MQASSRDAYCPIRKVSFQHQKYVVLVLDKAVEEVFSHLRANM